MRVAVVEGGVDADEDFNVDVAAEVDIDDNVDGVAVVVPVAPDVAEAVVEDTCLGKDEDEMDWMDEKVIHTWIGQLWIDPRLVDKSIRRRQNKEWIEITGSEHWQESRRVEGEASWFQPTFICTCILFPWNASKESHHREEDSAGSTEQ